MHATPCNDQAARVARAPRRRAILGIAPRLGHTAHARRAARDLGDPREDLRDRTPQGAETAVQGVRMRARGPALAGAFVAGLVASGLAGPLLAAPPPRAPGAPVTQADREAARSLAEKAFEHYEAGECPRAIALFRQAEERFHAPPHMLFIARCEAKTGRLLEAREIFQAIVDEKLSPDAPGPFRDAQVSARAELNDVEIRLPTLEIVLASAALGASVTLDGRAVARAQLGAPIPLNPGEHVVVATLGQARFERRARLIDGGGATRIDVTLAIAQAPSRRVNHVPMFIAFGVGVAGLGVGAATGILSLTKVGELEDRCPTKRCEPGLAGMADTAKTLGTASTIGFVVAGVGAATGGAFLVLRPFDEEPRRSGRTQLELGLGGVRLGGAF
jgi:hypothetical protein